MGIEKFETLFFEQSSQSRESILIMEWDKQRLSFSVFHEPANKVLATQSIEVPFDYLQATEQQLSQFLKNIEPLAYQYQKTICLLNHSYSTLVPRDFAVENASQDYLKLLFTMPNGQFETMQDKVLSSVYENLFLVPKNLQHALTSLIPNTLYKATAGVLLNTYAKTNLTNQMFFVHISEGLLYVTYYFENELKFHNSFTYIASEDIVYHIHNVFLQLGLSNENQPLFLSGMVTLNGAIHQMLLQYFQFVHFYERSHKLNYSNALNEMPSHYFTHHYSLFL